MKNYEAVIRKGPSVKLGPAFREIREVMPDCSTLQCLAVATWWTGKQPKVLSPILRRYTANVLDKQNTGLKVRVLTNEG